MKQVERAVILAAGLGTRLKWLTDQRPKALMQVAGEPAITRVIRHLVTQGIKEIVVNAHHHREQLQGYVGDGSRFGCRVVISSEPELLDSGGGVRKAMTLFAGEGPFVVHNADVLSDIKVDVLAKNLPIDGVCICLVPNPPYHAAGDFVLQHGHVSLGTEDRYTFAGVSVWQPSVFDDYAVGEVFSLVQPLRRLMEQGQCRGLLHQGKWFDIGRPVDLMRANRAFSR